MACRVSCNRLVQRAPRALSRRYMPVARRSFQVIAAHDDNGEAQHAQQDDKASKAVAPQRRNVPTFPSLYSSLMPTRMGSMFRQMEDEMNRMMQNIGADFTPFETALTSPTGGVLAVDVQDLEKEYVLTADLPGVPKENIKITVSPDNVLTISGERKQESSTEEGGFTRVERAYGSFQRTFKLPEHVDASAIKAKSDHGVLTLTLPKTEKEEANVVTVNVE